MSILIQPAAAAGFSSIMGRIAAAGDYKLDIPDGQINIGGHGKGFIFGGIANFDPLDPANNDGSFSTLELGDDVYIYAAQTTTGFAQLVCSKNATYPDGHTALSTRKIGGFHVGRTRPISERFSKAYEPTVKIVPNSVWDFNHRPTMDPTGMAEVPGGLWVSIYLASEGPGVWPEMRAISKYDAMPIRNLSYAVADFYRLARHSGGRLATAQEFLVYADGSPAGENNNLYCWAATGNSGPAATGTVAKAVSQYNIVDCAGNLWDTLEGMHDIGSDSGAFFSNRSDIVNVGQDAAHARGQMRTYRRNTSESSDSTWRAWIGGGNFDYADRCGPACLYSFGTPWYVNGYYGLRVVSDSQQANGQ